MYRSVRDSTLDGDRITKEVIFNKCKASFHDFRAITEKLKEQNEHFYDRDLIDDMLTYHISAAKSIGDLVPIKTYAESQGRWQNASVINQLAEQFLKFGDQDGAIACFGLAYACFGDSFFRWRGNTKYLAAIAARDRKVAMDVLLKECYDSARKSEGGYDTPPIAAAGLDILDESILMEAVFNDYLTHCEDMFAQLPRVDDYGWLSTYVERVDDFNVRLLDFIIDELHTPEIDHGERLIRALVRLAIARTEGTISLIVSRSLTSSGRSLRRLLSVLLCIASSIPEALLPHQQSIGRLLDRKDFFSRQSVLRIFDYIGKASVLEEHILALIQGIKRQYSTSIRYPQFRMSSTPSREFTSFLKRNTLFDFSAKLREVESILHLPGGSVVAAIEERLRSKEWYIEEEEERVKDEWHGNVHPQGWPVVWITTEFQELATDALCSVLDEASEKFSLGAEQIESLWRVIQIVDPNYVLCDIMPRPSDIHPIRVRDKEKWLSELAALEPILIGKGGNREEDEEWITVYEKRTMAQEEKYNVPYREYVSVVAFLIPQRVYGRADALDELELTTERIVPNKAMAVTIQQVQQELKDRGRKILDISHDCIPLVAVHQNPFTFFGYSSVCALTSFIISDYNLSLQGVDLIGNRNVVAKHEAWQEGYHDEAYTREKLSFGVRFRVRRQFLSDIYARYVKILCIRIDERREYHKSIYDRCPDESRDSRRYILHHL